MASPMDTWNALTKLQQAGVIGGGFVLLAGIFAYMTHTDLQYLGRDPDSALPSFLQFEGSSGSLWTQIEQSEQQIAQAEAVAATRPQVEKKLRDLEEEIEVVRELLPQEKDKESLRELLQRYARDVSPEFGEVSFSSVRIVEERSAAGRRGAKKVAPQFQSLVFQCQLEATMDGLIAYIDKVETSTDRFMAVQQLAVSPGNLTVDESTLEIIPGLHQVNLDVITYVYAEDAQ